ncbi:MAG: hypothetical protein FWB85_06545 [Chitinispirillia bacterium]|nr:hypothetical protein [Chitinispirillia bacterium]MCL2241881.1 hypothetical protein [Chitinispirillia bacterium]
MLIFPQIIPAPAAQDPIFSTEISARGKREHLIKVNRWGRYLVQAKSTEGVSLEVVDKLSGPFARAGEAGKRDGRVEVFLEAGYYKIFTEGPEDARGQVYLTVDRFSVRGSGEDFAADTSSKLSPGPLPKTTAKGPENPRAVAPKEDKTFVNGKRAGYLAPFDQTAAELAAGEAKAWWIFVPNDTLVYIEAMGRRLGGLAVFRSGEWLVAEDRERAFRSAAEFRAREDGRDINNFVESSGFRFANTSVPGKPLNGQRIFKRLERGKHLIVAYGGGQDGYTVTDSASPLYIQWMLPSVSPGRQVIGKIGVGGISNYSVAEQVESVIIESPDRERLTFAEYRLTTELISRMSLDTAGHRAFPGSLDPAGRTRFRSSGHYMLTIGGKPGSAFRLTPVNVSSMHIYTPPEDGAYRLSTIHSNLAGNNIGASGVMVDMKDTSIIALAADTVSVNRQLHRQFNLLGDITSYLWVDREGTYSFSPAGDASYDWRVRKFFVNEPRNYNPPRRVRGWQDITLDRGLYIIEITRYDWGKASFTIMSKSPGGPALNTIRPSAPRPSAAFQPLNLKKDRTYRVYMNRQGPDVTIVNIEKDTPPPREENPYIMNDAAEREEANTSRVSELAIGTPQYADIKQGVSKTYQFHITEPGIYKIETTGRLHTKLTARDRFNSLSFSKSGNGVGRNAVIAEYFLPGKYVLVAETAGKSAGRAGVVITKGEIAAGGRLENGIDRRAALKAHDAAVYDLVVDKKDMYMLESFIQSNPNQRDGEDYGGQRIRFEDASGWPVIRHGERSPAAVELDRGAYKFYSLPLEYDNYRATRAQVIETPTEFTGKDTSKTLFAGISRAVNLRSMIMPVRVDSAGVYEIFSQGREEISARLYGADSVTEVAHGSSDHRDWNFVISEQLDTGTYNLRLEKDRYYQETQVFMRRVQDTLTRAVNIKRAGAEKEMKISLSGKHAVIPIETSSGDVLIITASGNARIIAALESSTNKVIDRQRGKRIRISLPTERKSKYTLKIRQEERKDADVDIVVKTAESVPLTYEKVLAGIPGAAVKAQDNTVYYRIDGMPSAPAHYELISAPLGSPPPNRPDEPGIIGTAGVNETGTAFRDDGGFLIASGGKRLWIEAAFSSSEKYRFVLSPVRLTDIRETAERNRRKFETADKYRYSRSRVKYPERDELPVVVRPGVDKVFEIDSPMPKLGIVEMTLISGQPLAGLSTSPRRADFVRGAIPVLGGQYVDERYCLTAVIPGDTGRIVGWNALPGGPAGGVDGAFAMKSFAVDKFDSLKVGRTVWRTKAAQAKEYRIGQNRGAALTVKLSPHTGALYISADGNRNIYYGADLGAQHTFEPSGGRLFLFGRGDGLGAGDIEIEMYASTPSSAQFNILTAGREINKQVLVDTRATVRIKNEPSAAGRLFISGSAGNIRMINRSGQIIQNIKDGAAVTGQDGVLLVDYAPGHSKIRLCGDDGSILGLSLCRWGETVKKWNEAPAVREMSKLTMADGINWYSIDLAGPAHVSLNAPVPAAAIIAVDGLVRDYEEFWDGLSWDIPNAAGKFTIGLKPLSGKTLAGAPLTVGFYQITPLTEKEPLTLYLMPGEKRMVWFDIPRKNRVGLGLFADNGTAEASLLDKWGRSVTSGRQIFTELDGGTYHVLLSIPETAMGTDVKLYLFGRDNPPKDPPPELIQWIKSGGTGQRPR